MRITDITTTKKGRYAIFVEGEFVCSLHPEVFAGAGLLAGTEIEPAALGELQYRSELKLAKERALRMLAGQDYTARQLRERLCRHTDGAVAEEAVARMQELGLVDDGDYALRCARDLLRLKGYSPRRVGQELRRRGVGEAQVEAALAQFEGEDPRQAIAGLAARKYAAALAGDEAAQKKALGALLRLGYSYEDIRYVFRHPEEYIEG